MMRFAGNKGGILWFLLTLTSLVGGLRAQESFLAVEAHSGRVLVEHNADVKRPVASLAKIATAMVVLDWSKYSGANMSQYAVVPVEAAQAGGSNPMALIPGDRIQLREAMYSMLLGSDNVAAFTLADHVGRSIASRSGGSPQSAFVKEMNNLAGALGMTKTRFRSPHGHTGTSTARDLARLSIYAMRSTGFRFYVKQKSRKISSLRGGQSRGFTVANTNSLIGTNGINGLKAASSNAAGPCLALSADRKSLVVKRPEGGSMLTPRRMIAIVLASPNRIARGQSMIGQGWAGYEQWSLQGRPQGVLTNYITVPNP